MIRQTIKALVSTTLAAAVAADVRDTTHNVQNLVVLVQIFDKRHACSHESTESNWNLGYSLIMSL